MAVPKYLCLALERLWRPGCAVDVVLEVVVAVLVVLIVVEVVEEDELDAVPGMHCEYP